jgi:hypothetical protein
MINTQDEIKIIAMFLLEKAGIILVVSKKFVMIGIFKMKNSNTISNKAKPRICIF